MANANTGSTTIPTIKYETVDLGLPSGNLWATCNLGATKPEEYGLFYQWGDTKGYKDVCNEDESDGNNDAHYFGLSKYKYYDSSGTNTYSKYNNIDNKTILDHEDDAAFVALGGNWKIPSSKDFRELIKNTEPGDGTNNYNFIYNYNGTGVNGILLKSKINGNTIFFPAAGEVMRAESNSKYEFEIGNVNGDCSCWSSSLEENLLHGRSNWFGISERTRYLGMQIRPVKTISHEYINLDNLEQATIEMSKVLSTKINRPFNVGKPGDVLVLNEDGITTSWQTIQQSSEPAFNPSNNSYYIKFFNNSTNRFEYCEYTQYDSFDKTNKIAIGVTVISPTVAFTIALKDVTGTYRWSTSSTAVANIVNSTDKNVAGYDNNGYLNTTLINSAITSDAVRQCLNYTTNGTAAGDWYLGALQQITFIFTNVSRINQILQMCGGTTLVMDAYWTSTQASAGSAWYVNMSSGRAQTSKTNYYRVRPISNV